MSNTPENSLTNIFYRNARVLIYGNNNNCDQSSDMACQDGEIHNNYTVINLFQIYFVEKKKIKQNRTAKKKKKNVFRFSEDGTGGGK